MDSATGLFANTTNYPSRASRFVKGLVTSLHYGRLPSEIWFNVVGCMVRNGDKLSIRNLTLTCRYFRSLAQPALFTSLWMVLRVDTKEVKGAFQPPVSFKEYFMERLEFLISPTIAPAVKRVNIRCDGLHMFDVDQVASCMLLKTMFEKISLFSNVRAVHIVFCPLTFNNFEQLFTMKELTTLTIANSPFNMIDLPKVPPSLRLRHFTTYGNYGFPPFNSCDYWWLPFISPAIQSLEVPDKDLSDTLVTHLPSHPNLPFLHRLVIFAPSFGQRPHGFNIMAPLLNLRSLSMKAYPNFDSSPFPHPWETNIPDVPKTVVPLLTEITGYWSYVKPFTKHHPNLRKIDLERIKTDQVLPCLEVLLSHCPELTHLTFTPHQIPDARAVKIVLTQFPSLRELNIRASSVRDEVFDEILEFFKTANLTRTLQVVRIWSQTRLNARQESVDPEVDSLLRQQCPDLQHLGLQNEKRVLHWKR